MQALSALRPSGLLPLPGSRRLSRSSRANLAVTAAKGKASPAAEVPPAAAPAPPSDIPAYFQPAPVQPQAGQPQVYQAVPQYAAPPPPAAQPSFWSNIPPLVYVGVGVVLAGVLGKVMALIKGGPQKMQEMAMQQMMQQMMKQMGAPPGGASPFGAAGANPFGAAGGANPFGAAGANPFGAAGANPFGGASPFGAPPSPAGSGFPSMQPAYDTTATPATPAASATTASTAAPATDSSTTSGDSKPKKKSAFVDVNAGASSSGSSSSSSGSKEGAGADAGAGAASSSSTPPPFTMPPGGMPPFNMPPGGMPPFNMPPGAGGATGTGASGVANTMLDMLKNPEMQKMLYPYLPEPMRNQETFEWMLSNPEYRQQLEGMLQQQAANAGSPAVAEMMQGMDMSPEKMQAQFDALGMTPDQFIQKVMADPDLATMMTNPRVMTAIAECTKNPMAIFNYQNDAEILRVFEKMSTMFPQAAGAGAFPNMPPGFGQPPQQ